MLDLSNPATQDFVRGLAAELAETGDATDFAASVELYGALALGGDPRDIDLSNGDDGYYTDLSNELDDVVARNVARDAQVQAENAAPRLRLAEDRLARSLDRISRGTYLDFASPAASAAARQLAAARWGQQPGPVTGRPNCSGSDQFGYCISPTHDASCGSLASTDIAEGLRESGAYARLAAQPFQTANGVWSGRDGEPMTITDHVESATGERLATGSPFESGQGKRELVSPGADSRYGDPDDPERPSVPFSADTAATAWLVKEQMGIPKRDARAERERVADRVIAAQLGGRGPSRQFRAGEPHGNDRWDMASRRERIAEQYGSASPRLYGEPPIAGSLGHFEAG